MYIRTYNLVFCTLKMEISSDTCQNMDELWRHYAKQKKPVTKEHTLHDPMPMKAIKQSESQAYNVEWWLLREIEKKNLELNCLMAVDLQLCKMKKIFWRWMLAVVPQHSQNGWWWCFAQQGEFLYYIPKIFKIINFTLHMFYKKIEGLHVCRSKSLKLAILTFRM